MTPVPGCGAKSPRPAPPTWAAVGGPELGADTEAIAPGPAGSIRELGAEFDRRERTAPLASGRPRFERTRKFLEEWQASLGWEVATFGYAQGRSSGLGDMPVDSDCGCGCSTPGPWATLGAEGLDVAGLRDEQQGRGLGDATRPFEGMSFVGVPGGLGEGARYHLGRARTLYPPSPDRQLHEALGAGEDLPVFYLRNSECWSGYAEDHWCHKYPPDEDRPDADLEEGDTELLNWAWWKAQYYWDEQVIDYFSSSLKMLSAETRDMAACFEQRVKGLAWDPFGNLWYGPAQVWEWNGLAYIDGVQTQLVASADAVDVHAGLVRFSSYYLASTRARLDVTSDDGNVGDWHCPIAEVTGVIYHELLHTCGKGDELAAMLLTGWFRQYYRARWAMNDELCCQTIDVMSYWEDSASCMVVGSSVRGMGYWVMSESPSSLHCGTVGPHACD